MNRFFFPDESATSQLLSDLAFGLVDKGFDVHVLCSRQLYGDASAVLRPCEAVDGVAVHRLWTTRFGRRGLIGRACDYLTFYASCGFRLLALLRAGDFVVAKTDPPLISVISWFAARVKRAHLINWLQDVFPEVATKLGANPLPAVLDGLLMRVRDASLRAALCNVVLGVRMRDYVAGRIAQSAPIVVIENWADIQEAPPKLARESALRARLGLSDKFVIGYSGNLGRAHEFATMLAAATQLKDDPKVAFLFIGGGINMDAMQREAATLCLKNIYFLPYQPRATLSDSLAAADLHLTCLLPDLEGLIVPSKFYGILAAGRPVVFIGDLDGELARIIGESGCGRAIEVGRPDDLVALVRQLQADPGLLAHMGVAAHELLRANYSKRRAIDQWCDLLSTIHPRAVAADTSSLS